MTFTVLATDGSGSVGVCQISGSIGIASRCPQILGGSAVVSSQSHSDWRLGHRALDLAVTGMNPRTIIDALSRTDPHFAYRQLGIVTADGHVAAHTGTSCGPYAGHRLGTDFVAMGNALVGPAVVDAMAASFESTRGTGTLEDRLMRTIEAGVAAGGEGHLHRAGDLIAAGRADTRRPRIDIRVDGVDVAAGIDVSRELRRILDEHEPLIGYYGDYWLDHPETTTEEWLRIASATSVDRVS